MRKIEAANFETMLREGALRVPPLDIRIIKLDRGDHGGDTVVEVAWRGRTCRYVAVFRRDAKPQTLKLAIDQVKQYTSQLGQGQPMIIAPYFSGEKLDELLEEGISAIDFSGNAAIEAPGRFLFYKTGNPNGYRDSSPIRSAYRGSGSLVARALLLDRQFQAVGNILSAIKNRGGALTMGTVSKILKRLEADLVIERPSRNAVRVIQPERLLQGLLDAYQPPKIENIWTGKVAMPTADLLARLEGFAEEGNLVRTGESSAGEYAVWAGEPIIACYCSVTPARLLERLDAQAKETRGFPNLRLIQTEDKRVYFDRRPKLAASPIQSWLEMASGDKRQKEAAEQIKSLLLNTVGVRS